jgi:uncharacterized membrane protein YGL010W
MFGPRLEHFLDCVVGFLSFQIHPGHAVFERRKPALMDSLVQVGIWACFDS